ncbi:hypothetical protein ACP_2405 [Acidobacterium capsulatum ATCC 51196]|uniref:Uncharacterized protein n=1 Tax=Acidobacterium capsulatum (strain ATCC 51196 / DSM 11244 / BCRC 80197 / JCM 7670 / NBRC 15755 / NCIMB 13165 / 161) TaxID=240015 RepID=C1F1A1_ACIC5|nr:hypothetical protein ACP_2405 [Acidobacterium capsulatum ATCC 51196]
MSFLHGRSGDGDVAVAAFGLQQRDGGHLGGDGQDAGIDMGQPVFGDLFRLLAEVAQFDELAGLLLDGGVAAEKVDAAMLEGLNAGVLVERIGAVGTAGGVLETVLAGIEDVAFGRLAGFRVGDLEPFADLVLLPDVVIHVEHVGRPVQGGGDLDLVCWNAKAEVQAIERVLDVVEEAASADGDDVVDLLDACGVMRQGVEVRDLPGGSGGDELRIGGRGKTGHGGEGSSPRGGGDKGAAAEFAGTGVFHRFLAWGVDG